MSSHSLVTVHDELTPCPYLPGRTARMPLQASMGGIVAKRFDDLLADGYRRTGVFVYQTRCPSCRECQATRVIVDEFRWGRSFKRVLARAKADLTFRWEVPSVDADRLTLFNRHRTERGLESDEAAPADEAGYRAFLADSCCQTLELSIRHAGRLVAVSLMDVGSTAISMVYTYFDPDASRYSLGTLAVLRQIIWAAEHRRRYAYLGFYVTENPHLNYKARFTPQQRYDGRAWQLVI